MARNRDERYEHAGLMAQHLRELHLSPATTTSTRDSGASSSEKQRAPRDRKVVHPPKRPQGHRPRYLELAAAQPPPGEARERSPRQSPGAPERELSPAKGKIANIAFEDEVPTRPLSPIMDEDTHSQQQIKKDHTSTKPDVESRRTLWRQLQRIFKSSAT
jgi:hypothetical protein